MTGVTALFVFIFVTRAVCTDLTPPSLRNSSEHQSLNKPLSDLKTQPIQENNSDRSNFIPKIIETEQTPGLRELPQDCSFKTRLLHKKSLRLSKSLLPPLPDACTTSSGEEGLCCSLIKCLSFYPQLMQFEKQPCRLRRGKLGVCCPWKVLFSDQCHLKDNKVIQVPLPQRIEIQKAISIDLQKVQQKSNPPAKSVYLPPSGAGATNLVFVRTTNSTTHQGESGKRFVRSTEYFDLSPRQSRFDSNIFNTYSVDLCPPSESCSPWKYRAADGSCNNLINNRWGMVGTQFQRILRPEYDGENLPRTKSVSGHSLPSTRLVSTHIADDVNSLSGKHNVMFMQMGQFLGHDLTLTPLSRVGDVLCCNFEGQEIPQNQLHPDCFPIKLPNTDRTFSHEGITCMPFVRSLAAERSDCTLEHREQVNHNTGFLDGSNIYSSHPADLDRLRLFWGGELRAQNFSGQELLPANPLECSSDDNTMHCFHSGDIRANEQVNLAAYHTIFMMEHNRIARELQKMHPRWSDEALFQETRRIVVAEMQHIIYSEYLPIVLGHEYMKKNNLLPKKSGWTYLYDPNIHPGITNVFATAAFRFGHTLITSHMQGYGRSGKLEENFRLSKTNFEPFGLYNPGVMDNMVRGMMTQKCQNYDRYMTEEITEHLFQRNAKHGLDLFAMNNQRGRDHGLPPYNDWREICGLSRARTWSDLEENMDKQTIAKLSEVYSSVDDIDLYTGMLCEHPAWGAMVGPTFICLIGDQFLRLRRGDRFHYEEGNQSGSFTHAQLQQIRKSSMARIICDNTGVHNSQISAFMAPSNKNPKVSCESNRIQRVNLRHWQNEVPAVE